MVPAFSPFWKIAAAGALALAVVASLTGYGLNACQHRKATAQTEARVTRRTASKQVADSAYFFDAGRHYEIQRQLDQLTNHAETLPATAPLRLPVAPAHQ